MLSLSCCCCCCSMWTRGMQGREEGTGRCDPASALAA